MSTINTNQDLFSSIGVRTTADTPVEEATSQQADFLLLMTEQIKHQNPLDPLDGKDFLAQLAQLSSVQELAELNQGFTDLSNSLLAEQSLQAASLIGKYATVVSSDAVLDANQPIAGSAYLPLRAENLTFNYYDQAGQLVHSQDMGSRIAGEVSFSWDGSRDQSEPAEPGIYRVEALADFGDGTEALVTRMDSRISSVDLGAGGSIGINLDGLGQVSLSDIRQLRDNIE